MKIIGKGCVILCVMLCAVMLLAGCRKTQEEEQTAADQAAQEELKEQEAREKEEREREEQEKAEAERQKALEEQQAEEAARAAKLALTIVLDPGHSGVVAQGSEPLGPGSSEYKAADSGGTSGIASGIPEYELNLTVALQLKTELENRGYTVLMTRESNDVPMSCIQRAEVANNAAAAAYVRIHANGSENQNAQGAMTICTTPQSPYVPELYSSSRALSDGILTSLCQATGCISEGVWETDTMSGNNWSQVPVTIVEMGYMTNPEEDMRMQTPEYQAQIVQGIANGIDVFLGYGGESDTN